jgi:beta-galactosidase
MKMKKLHLPGVILTILLSAFGISGCKQSDTGLKSRTISFDKEWRFLKNNPSGAETPAFDDKNWRMLDLPHDWSIEDLPDQKEGIVTGPFSKESIGKMGTGYTIGGTAWYRKTFTIDKADKNKIVYLQFDGVYMNSDVWVNGKHVGNHPYGYTSFYYDITPFLNPPGSQNNVAVQVKNEGKNARWYSGSGIYRHTWLTIVNPVHVSVWGTYVTTPEVSEKNAKIEIVTNVTNSGKEETPVTLQLQLLDPSGKIVGTTTSDSSIPAGNSAEIKQYVEIINPVLWSVDSPNLYQALITVLVKKKVSDNFNTTFGIRSIHFDARSGFTLNGNSMELKGGCFHHDNGPLGSAAIDRAEERKIELLKKAGFNAIRCSHNPPSPALLDACDRLGMLVIDEFADMWEKPKVSPDDYSKYIKTNWKNDLGSIILRDRNHPSVIMWSIGNEIPEAADTSGLRIAGYLAAEVRRLDPTRAVTEAMVDFESFTTGKSGWQKQAPHMALLDVVGYNYSFNSYKTDHEKYPDRIIYASEFMPPLSLQNWQTVEELPYVIGNFSWTAMDYLGEAGVGLPRLVDTQTSKPGAGSDPMAGMMIFFSPDSWPVFNNFQGDIDLIGNPKTPYYYQHVVWRENKIEMFVHKPIPQGQTEIVSPWGFPDELKSWNWEGHEGEKMQVHVYTRSKMVKLELNGKLIGEQAVDDSKSITATFEVPYKSGTLTARCFDNGVETASETIKTIGKPAIIRLTADRSIIKADVNDLSYVMAEILDSDGNIVPYADEILVNFDISGNGIIAGVGSGSPSDMSSFQQPRKKTWQGRCLVIVRPKGEAGKILLTARAEGLGEAAMEIIVEN